MSSMRKMLKYTYHLSLLVYKTDLKMSNGNVAAVIYLSPSFPTLLDLSLVISSVYLENERKQIEILR
jgi:hypothetical protein